jgi:tetratricopeptide (TPR) repeat protein
MANADENSPRFVVQVLALLSAGKTENAIAACRAGITGFPWYGTGYWLLGKCYEARGDRDAAREQYGEAAKRLPGNEAIRAALERTRVRATENAGEDVEAMLRRLQDARRPQLTPRVDESPLLDISVPNGETGIVTATLAEIYAQQGEYREALVAYKRLIQQRPDDAGRHAVRIAELEELLQRADKLREP